MSAFELPANIKQIGSIGAGLRIYMEDYVCSYLQQYTSAGGYDEKLSLLIGRRMVIDGQDILFISGAVQGRYIKIENGISIFTQKSLDYANETIKKHFRGMEIVGWAQSQPSYGVFLNTAYAEYHMNVFREDHNVLFVMDPIEKIDCFYTYATAVGPGATELPNQRDIVEAPGYFIYYEKNKGMHEYMLENKADPELTLPNPVEEEPPEQAPETEMESVAAFKDVAKADVLIRNRQSFRNLKKATLEQRRVLNLLVTLSSVLFIICFIMGAGLIQNRDRISSMESQLVQLSTSYRNLLLDLRDNTASVFAANPDENALSDEQTEDEPPDSIDGGATETTQMETEAAILVQEDGNRNLSETLPASVTEKSPTAEAPTTEAPITEAPVPPTTQPPTQKPAANEAAAIQQYDTYTVQQGDSLSYISILHYGTASMVKKIMEANDMPNDTIYYGKVLKLPK